MKYLYIFILTLVLSCNNDKHVKYYKIPKFKEVSKNQDFIIEDSQLSFTWDVPKNWVIGKKSSMRLASYSIPYNNLFADVSVTNFSGDGGGIEQNVNRWRKQLNLEPQSIEIIERNIQNKKSDLGNYKFLKIINPTNEESAFLCSIITVKNSTIFVKLNATVSGVDKLENQFLEFCSSFKF